MATRTAIDRKALLDEYLRLKPVLKRRFGASLPLDLREQMRSVTMHQLEALSRIYPGGLTMRELARTLEITDGSATTLADRLVRQGLADRVADERDRRVVRLVPSKEGASIMGRLRNAERRTAKAAFDVVDDEQLVVFVRVLELLAESEVWT